MAGSQHSQLTPMMAQYRQIKNQLPDNTLLLFHLGDFYELFYDDAKIGSSVLGLVLTKRNGVPMCGIPVHSATTYINRLLKAGYRVALCDQLEEPRPGKLVRRDVTQILSPGTHIDEQILEADRNNYLAGVCSVGKMYGLAYLDLSTGEFKVTETDSEYRLLVELMTVRPAEVIYPAEDVALVDLLRGKRLPADQPHNVVFSPTDSRWIFNGYDGWVFDVGTAEQVLSDHFKVITLDGFGLKGHQAAISAAGAIIHYLTQQLRRDLQHVTRISFYQQSQYLFLDHSTIRNLEVLEPLSKDAPPNASLYGVLNRTVTPMGARRLRQWLVRPLNNLNEIVRRLAAVEIFTQFPQFLDRFRKQLTEVRDLERTLSRITAGNATARELVRLRIALEQIPPIKETLTELVNHACSVTGSDTLVDSGVPSDQQVRTGLLKELISDLEEQPGLVDVIKRAIVDDPPATVKEGGIIKDGFDPQLDELRAAMRNHREWIAQLQQREIQRTGIQSLKVRYNAVFGYYIEVTKANLDKVPPDYIRKQTLVGAERFITPELKEIESKILGAEERSVKLEYELFQQVREQVLSRVASMQRTANALATLDVLASFAEVARLYDYCKPEIGDEGFIIIRDGRHPVLEQCMVGERFVPNDTELAASTSPPLRVKPSSEEGGGELRRLPQIALITGPNMAGKSTYIRQVALITLMAHIGCFVPAKEARIDLVDRIFTRIGAGDDLARGQSTFMVEMTETANILNNATPRSLIVLDEVGRGTSTFDGIALAWSIVEYLHNRVGAKTLFATHYHELTELAGQLPRMRNYNVAVREWQDRIIFLHKIIEGATDRSYGLHVARLAGVPQDVIARARVILANLEETELTPQGTRRSLRRERDRERLRQIQPTTQLDLFA